MTSQKHRHDIGLSWAKGMNIWGQFTVIMSVANTAMMIGVFYTTTVADRFNISFLGYIGILVAMSIPAVFFIIKWGISGYYRYFSQQSELAKLHQELAKLHKDIKLIKQSLGVLDDDNS